MMRCRLKSESIWLLAAMLAVGCASQSSQQAPTTLTREEFAALYDDTQAVTDVWYMGSDGQYSHFCMEHWTVTSDGNDAKLDSRKFYQVPITEVGVKNPFPVTSDESLWRLMRPKKLPKDVAGS
jgi:hypothetical protein